LTVCEQGAEDNIGPKTDEVMGGWRKLNNELVCDVNSLPSIIRIMKWRRAK
jgi:hypothetical protein